MNQELTDSRKRDLQWATVKSAVRRLKDNPDFKLYIEELELMQYQSRLRSYDPEVKKNHVSLLEETVFQEVVDHILIAAEAESTGKLSEKDDELSRMLEDEPTEADFRK